MNRTVCDLSERLDFMRGDNTASFNSASNSRQGPFGSRSETVHTCDNGSFPVRQTGDAANWPGTAFDYGFANECQSLFARTALACPLLTLLLNACGWIGRGARQGTPAGCFGDSTLHRLFRARAVQPDRAATKRVQHHPAATFHKTPQKRQCHRGTPVTTQLRPPVDADRQKKSSQARHCVPAWPTLLGLPGARPLE